MNDVLYLARACSATLASMVTHSNNFSKRSWSSEYTRRLARRLLDVGVNETDQWLRDKQGLLSMKGPALLKVHSSHTVHTGVDCLEVTPKSGQASERVVIYLHGGGYVVGSAASYHYTLAKVALACSAKVVGADYRLAPEHALEDVQGDCLKVAESFMAKGHDIVLMGDSAGAGLCLELAKRLNSQSESPQLAGMVLISPWVAPDQPELLNKEFHDGDILSEAILSRWNAAIQTDGDKCSGASYVELDCKGFPKTYIQAGGAELFLGQIEALFGSMQAQGVDVSLDVFDQQFHVFQTFAPLVTEADSAIDKIGDVFRQF